jgi:hypothetical protein
MTPAEGLPVATTASIRIRLWMHSWHTDRLSISRRTASARGDRPV